jgi:hypothetical protein
MPLAGHIFTECGFLPSSSLPFGFVGTFFFGSVLRVREDDASRDAFVADDPSVPAQFLM